MMLSITALYAGILALIVVALAINVTVHRVKLRVPLGDGGNQDLHYLLAWESLAEREKKWNAFATDPEWLSKRAESERDGPLVASIKNMFLQPTSFSAVQ